MAGKADFTDDEWNTLHRGATGAGMLVALSERGFASTFKESGALARYFGQARTDASSQLVRELAAVHGTGWKVSSSPDEVRAGTIAALTSSVTTLQAKSPDDLDEYRTFVLAVAEAVAAAAKGGDEAEAAEIATIREALG